MKKGVMERGCHAGKVFCFLLMAALIVTGCTSGIKSDAGKGSHQIAVLSDVHIPGNNLPLKERALQAVNSWSDVDLVVVTGDIVATGGSAEEYASAKAFFSKLDKPLRMVGGNHDYIYPDSYPRNPATGHTLKEPSPEHRYAKLERFKKTWGLKELFYSERLGNYLLVFLTPDELVSNNYAQMTDRQLHWLRDELERNKKLPTIVFFHAPLAGTYKSRYIAKTTTPDSYNAEPAGKIRDILLKNKQVILWVCGHLHIAPPNQSYNHSINLYENQVWVIHNADMNGSSFFSEEAMKATKHYTIWTRTLVLYPNRVVVRTYDHKHGLWLKHVERTITVP
jgi:3',5'-cyclic AMP phosphodiesterase CpdA